MFKSEQRVLTRRRRRCRSVFHSSGPGTLCRGCHRGCDLQQYHTSGQSEGTLPCRNARSHASSAQLTTGPWRHAAGRENCLIHYTPAVISVSVLGVGYYLSDTWQSELCDNNYKTYLYNLLNERAKQAISTYSEITIRKSFICACVNV